VMNRCMMDPFETGMGHDRPSGRNTRQIEQPNAYKQACTAGSQAITAIVALGARPSKKVASCPLENCTVLGAGVWGMFLDESGRRSRNRRFFRPNSQPFFGCESLRHGDGTITISRSSQAS
jgi:hypothetical protein